ncbi:MAG: type III-B CRISPR module RAMP protein Cmr6 [Nitrospinae bacterium]|nr:type III-B CRISPR module RAMP protein Cmr6 [Nitrospinota bacterium]
MNLPLPKETREYFGNNKNRLLKISNLGLLFNKYVSAWSDDWMTDEKRGKEKVNLKAEFLGKIEKESFYINQSKDAVDSIYKRQLSMIQGLKSSNWHIESFAATTDSRLIIGLGGTSVIETGMTLHPLYGFPYLPGSGLKGLARAYAEIGVDAAKDELLEIFGSDHKNQHKATEDNRQGKVFFMDGLPSSFPKLDLDIMNPHYGEYYRGEKPPADYLNPVPVTFLAVATGQIFSFAVFSRDKELAEKAKSWLIGGLTELGAGGKTNVGYGYFKLAESKSLTNDPMSSSETKHFTVLPVEHIVWKSAVIKWNPGNETLTAVKEGKKSELKLKDKNIIPESFRQKLFDKRKSIEANIELEKTGNSFRIIKVF